MRAHILIVLLSLVACSSEDRGDGRKSTFAGNPGGPQAIGNNGSAPSFGENAGSGPSFGENAGSAPSFGESGGGAGQPGDPTQACSKSAPCAAPAECTSTSSSGVGFCVARCTLSSTTADIEAGLCPAALQCFRIKSKSTDGVCLHTCATSADCPTLAGLSVGCVAAPNGRDRFCLWTTTTTETTPATPAGG